MSTDANSKIAAGFVDRSRRAIMTGILACTVLVGAVGGWMVTAKLSGAVVTHGNVVVATALRSVQHSDGGIVGEILVNNGERVRAGDVVLSLDDKLLRANLALVDDQLVALDARLARLTAERDGSDDLVLSQELQSRSEEPEVITALAAQEAVLEAARLTRAGQVAAYEEQVAQLHQQITGLQEQRAATDKQVTLIDHELSGLETLFEKGLTPETRITALKRERFALLGSSGSYTSQMAVARGKISETRLAILQLEKGFREKVMNEISSLMPELSQLKERRSTADLQLARIEVRAPVDGIVHELAVHTVGGVVMSGEMLMQIVPDADNLVVTAMVAPQDINHVSVGQDAALVIGAFDQKVVPRLDGMVSFVSPDLKTDEKTGAALYEVRIALGDSAVTELAERDLALLPGMPAEVYISTSDRTVAEYLAEPLAKQIRTTFRES